jgi:TatD DNase family protein
VDQSPVFFDTHAHLTSREFDADREEVIARAHQVGVRWIINPGVDLEDSRRAVDLAAHHPGVYAAVGFHPHEAKKADAGTLASLEELSTRAKVVAIGEIGLDFHYDLSPRQTQREVFRAQLEIAARRNLPVIIHTRESLDETVGMVEEFIRTHPAWRQRGADPANRYPEPRGVFHCFPGTPATAWKLIEMGFRVSLPGIVTFKNAGDAAAVAGGVSTERLMLETDSPYLTPVPHRGTRNEPAYTPLIAARIAELQGLTVGDVARATGYAAYKLFGVGDPPVPVFTYPLKNSLYVNLTIRCNADCVFCDRKGEAVVKGHNLKIEREPTPDEVIEEIGDPTRFAEIVFCGYGEPTIRLDALKHVARWVKDRGGVTRLNTDGHGSIINKRNIIPELVGLIDTVSISLNSTDPGQYGALMRLEGARFFPAMVEFAREAVRLLPRVVMTIVDLDEVNEARARQLVETDIGAVFSKRPYF